MEYREENDIRTNNADDPKVVRAAWISAPHRIDALIHSENIEMTQFLCSETGMGGAEWYMLTLVADFYCKTEFIINLKQSCL